MGQPYDAEYPEPDAPLALAITVADERVENSLRWVEQGRERIERAEQELAMAQKQLRHANAEAEAATILRDSINGRMYPVDITEGITKGGISFPVTGVMGAMVQPRLERAHSLWWGYARGQCGAVLADGIVCERLAEHDDVIVPTNRLYLHRAHDPQDRALWVEYDESGQIRWRQTYHEGALRVERWDNGWWPEDA